MSELAVELESGPIEGARADVAIVTFFEDERPLRGEAGRADWRLCGQLSELLTAGRIAGRRGEAVLVPARGGLCAPLVMALGLGARAHFDTRAWRAISEEAVRRGGALGARCVALSLPGERSVAAGLRPRLDALLAGATRALAARPGDLELRVVASPEDARRAGELLAGSRPAGVPPGVTVRFGAPPRRPRPPAGGERGPLRTPAGFK